MLLLKSNWGWAKSNFIEIPSNEFLINRRLNFTFNSNVCYKDIANWDHGEDMIELIIFNQWCRITVQSFMVWRKNYNIMVYSILQWQSFAVQFNCFNNHLITIYQHTILCSFIYFLSVIISDILSESFSLYKSQPLAEKIANIPNWN